MSLLSIVGLQWGDEGKGKITDFLSKKADVVVRYQGGNNAGHSIEIKNKKYHLNLLPSGVFNPKITNVIANGVVIDIEGLKNEIVALEKVIGKINLIVSNRSHIVLPYHKKMDELLEELKGDNKIGTTKRGIGISYSDKALRSGIRIVDLYDDKLLKEKISQNLEIKNILFEKFNYPKIDSNKVFEELKIQREFIKKYVSDTSLFLNNEISKGKNILFEGAQGVMLCLDHGTYPFVTSSSPTPSAIPLNTGTSPNYQKNNIGIVKAYTTRVGAGSLPTEMKSDLSEQIRIKGNEFGVVSGRPRRIGWFDSVVVKYTSKVSGITTLAITLLDVLTGMKKIKIATSYIIEGKKVSDTFPANENLINNSKIEYIEMDGWSEDISKIKSYSDFPENTKKYLKKIEELVGIPISIVSVGPNRDQTIELKDNWKYD